MKRCILGILLCCGLVFGLLPGGARAAGLGPEVSAASAVVLHAESGTVLYEKNADQQMLVASTTKLMTALVVLEQCALDETVEILWEDVQVEGSAMYLRPGESYTVEDLLHGLLLASGNDAALALARHAAGTVEDFAALMNEKCRELALTNSHFVNPHGLDAEGHYASARDLAVLMAAAMENADFARICGAVTYTTHGVSYANHNKLLRICEGVIGGKTGYTMAAGRSLVSCCERDGMRLICVTISAPDDWNDHARLYDWAYDSYTDDPGPFADFGLQIPVLSGTQEKVALRPQETPRVLRSRDATASLRIEAPRFAYAAVEAGDVAGRLVLMVNGVEAGETPLLFDEAVPRAKTAVALWSGLRRTERLLSPGLRQG